MQCKEGVRSPEKREGRALLTVRDPQVEKLLAGLNLDGPNMDRVRQFCKTWCRDRNSWSIAQHSRGLFGGGRPLGRQDAGHIWSKAFSEPNGGGE